MDFLHHEQVQSETTRYYCTWGIFTQFPYPRYNCTWGIFTRFPYPHYYCTWQIFTRFTYPHYYCTWGIFTLFPYPRYYCTCGGYSHYFPILANCMKHNYDFHLTALAECMYVNSMQVLQNRGYKRPGLDVLCNNLNMKRNTFEDAEILCKSKSDIWKYFAWVGSEIVATNTDGVQFGRWLFIASRVNIPTVWIYQTKDCIEFKPSLPSWYLLL